MGVSFCLPHPVAVSAFMICRGLCTEMLWKCVLYVSFGSKVRPRVVLLFCFVQAKTYVGMVICRSWLHLCLCVWM